jgi:hypothetical protein
VRRRPTASAKEDAKGTAGLPPDTSIIALDRFIQSTRDSGYKGTVSAIAELVDNALEASARRIDINIRKSPTADDFDVTILDDGIGMDAETLTEALRFGGTSPKLRSLRDGLNALGISSDEMLQHGIEKVVYGATMVSNTSRYLLRLDDRPQYLFSLDEAQASTAKIAQYWFERWASTRIGRSDTEERLLAHTLVRPIRHGARVVLPSDDDDQLSFRTD